MSRRANAAEPSRDWLAPTGDEHGDQALGAGDVVAAHPWVGVGDERGSLVAADRRPEQAADAYRRVSLASSVSTVSRSTLAASSAALATLAAPARSKLANQTPMGMRWRVSRRESLRALASWRRRVASLLAAAARARATEGSWSRGTLEMFAKKGGHLLRLIGGIRLADLC